MQLSQQLRGGVLVFNSANTNHSPSTSSSNNNLQETSENQRSQSKATKVNFGLQYTENFEDRQYSKEERNIIVDWAEREIISNKAKYKIPKTANSVNRRYDPMDKFTIDGHWLISLRIRFTFDQYYDYNGNIINEKQSIIVTIFSKEIPNVEYIPLLNPIITNPKIYPFLNKFDRFSLGELLINPDKPPYLKQYYDEYINDIVNNLDSIFYLYPTNFSLNNIVSIKRGVSSYYFQLEIKDHSFSHSSSCYFYLEYSIKPKEDYIKPNSIFVLKIGSGKFDETANEEILSKYGNCKGYIDGEYSYIPTISDISIQYSEVKDNIVIYKCSSNYFYSNLDGDIRSKLEPFEIHITGFTDFPNKPGGLVENSGLIEDSRSNLWIYIAIGGSALLLIIIIVSIVVSKKKKQQKNNKQNVRVQQVGRPGNQQVKTITTSRTIPTKSSSPTFKNPPPSPKRR